MTCRVGNLDAPQSAYFVEGEAPGENGGGCQDGTLPPAESPRDVEKHASMDTNPNVERFSYGNYSMDILQRARSKHSLRITVLLHGPLTKVD